MSKSKLKKVGHAVVKTVLFPLALLIASFTPSKKDDSIVKTAVSFLSKIMGEDE
jgi:hypothetical protein